MIMKTEGKIDYRFTGELRSRHNPFLNFAQKIKQLNSQNFIVEWQMGGNEKKDVSVEQVYGMLF